MTALGLLSAIRKGGLHDDEARILLCVANGFRRFTDLIEQTGIKETTLRKMIKSLKAQGRLESEDAPQGVVGRGKCTVYSLTGGGIAKVMEIINAVPEPLPSRPIPAGFTLTVAVRGNGLCFLQS